MRRCQIFISIVFLLPFFRDFLIILLTCKQDTDSLTRSRAQELHWRVELQATQRIVEEIESYRKFVWYDISISFRTSSTLYLLNISGRNTSEVLELGSLKTSLTETSEVSPIF